VKEYLPMFAALSVLLPLTLNILVHLSHGKRRHRLGVTALACVCILSSCAFILKAVGDPLPRYVWHQILTPGLILSAAWAMWDLSRYSRYLGTSSVMSAFEAARSYVKTRPVISAAWAAWVRSLPMPAWIKTDDGVMLCVNAAYERAYGKSSASYPGNEDHVFWPDSVADAFNANDEVVRDTLRTRVVREKVPVWHDNDHSATFLKFPILDDQGRLTGVGGVAISYSELQQ